jgi:hypothetical protein
MTTGKWSFPLNQNGPIQGFNDQGIEYFLGNPIESLAKEIIQNSIDAGLQDELKPVRVEFRKFYINTNDIPEKEKLIEFYLKGIESWPENENVVNFCKKAIESLSGLTIECLRISDFNTRGITGSNVFDQNSAWFNLTKGSGSTEKVGTAGGSKGIGKNAVFSNSSLRLVFYSTVDETGLMASQGLLKMVSLKGLSLTSETEQTMGPIYYGNEKAHSPLKHYLTLDDSYKRDLQTFGSDIFIIGFNPKSEDWEKKIIEKTLLNFMFAIHSNRLEVNVEGYNLTKENYLTYLQNRQDRKNVKDLIAMANVLSSKDTLTTSHLINNLGEFEVRVLKMAEADSSKKCWLIRKPWMMISSIKSTYLPLLPFTALVIIKGVNLNMFLRKLESAKHDSWEIERAGSKLEKKEAETIIKFINQKVVESIKSAFNLTSTTSITPIGDELVIEHPGNDILENTEVINSKKPLIKLERSRNLKAINKKIKEDPMIYNPETGKLEPSENGDFTVQKDDINPIDEGNHIRKTKIRPGNEFTLIDGKDTYFLLGIDSVISAKLLAVNLSMRHYKVFFVLENTINKLSLRLNEIDSEGNKFIVIIEKALYSNKELRIVNGVIFFDEVI